MHLFCCRSFLYYIIFSLFIAIYLLKSPKLGGAFKLVIERSKYRSILSFEKLMKYYLQIHA